MLLKKILITSITACILFFYFETSLASSTIKEEIEDAQTTPKIGAMDIRKITPVTDEMDEEEAILAITAFFKTEVFNPKNEIKESEIKNREERDTGPGTRSFSVLTLEDGTEWVLGDRSIQRFLAISILKNQSNIINL